MHLYITAVFIELVGYTRLISCMQLQPGRKFIAYLNAEPRVGIAQRSQTRTFILFLKIRLPAILLEHGIESELRVRPYSGKQASSP